MQDALAGRQAMHSLQEGSVPVGLREFDDVLDAEVRGGVGDPGDAVGCEPAADVRKSGFPALQRIRPMRIGAAQPPVGVIRQSDPGQAGRVERPQHAAAVLHANRNGGRQVVEHVAVERTCDGFVVSDGPDPAVFADGHAGQHSAERFAVGDLPWSDAHRRQCRCSGMQVDVVVVQAGDDGAVRGVEHQLTRGGDQSLANLEDAVLRSNVDHGSVQQGRALNQHGAKPFSSIMRSTRASCSPSAAAGGDGRGGRGGSAGRP